jgi:glycosyltransferase involved in cell wall biosynthesis
LSLSVALLTYNSEKYLSEVLESVKGIADELIALDSGSTDRTVEILNSYGAKVFTRPFDNFVNQKNHLLSLCTKEWVLFLDDDEVLTPELAESVREAVKGGEKDGYFVNRLTYYLGRWIRHAWYPDWQLRLAKRDKCRWVGSEVHESLKVSGTVGYLKGDLLHYSYPDLSTHLKKIDFYTTLYARGAYRRGKRFSLSKLILSPPGAFLRRFLLKRGFLDGFQGFVVSVMASYYSFLKYLKLWEIERNENSRGS